MLPEIFITRFGLHLRQMNETDIETIWRGRNEPFVRNSHFYQAFISREEHQKWYERVLLTQDYYLIASIQGKSVGLLYLKDIQPGMKSGQIGVFFWSEKILRTRNPILAIITFVDFFMFSAGLQKMDCIVRPENKAMVHIIRDFGFDFSLDAINNRITGALSQAAYLERQATLIGLAQKLNRNSDTWNLRLSGKQDSRHHPEINRLIA